MVELTFEANFRKNFEKIRDKKRKQQIVKQLIKLKENPYLGKPMRYARKGNRELYIAPYRLSYRLEGEHIYLLEIYHKDKQ